MESIVGHIKKMRLGLKSSLGELAEKFGDYETKIYLWEKNQVLPSLALIPRII